MHKESRFIIITGTRILMTGLIISLSAAALWAAPPSIGGYNVYYGMLHNHSTFSDGSGDPDDAYTYARDNSALDFFSLADHCSYPYGSNDGLTESEYEEMKGIADDHNDDGVFTAFYGFEWTSDDDSWGGPSTLLAKGHITVINSPDHVEADDPDYNELNELVSWLNTRNAIAFFNHPGQYYDPDFENFNFNITEKIAGIELWNRSDDFYENGYWYHMALDKSWIIGASGSEDHHGTNWGAGNWRMAILAPELTRESLFSAMQERRFYSARDKNLALSFKCNGSQMGSKIDGGSLTFQIDASDGNDEEFSKIDLLKNGSVLETWRPNETSPSLSYETTGAKDDYFYIRVYQGGGWQAISSPIFISSDGPVTPPELTITSPNGGENWQAGEQYTITWDYSGNITDVDLEYSVNGGGWETIKMSTRNDGSTSWTVPPEAAGSVKIRITETGGSISDESEGEITIEDSSVPVLSPHPVFSILYNGQAEITGTIRHIRLFDVSGRPAAEISYPYNVNVWNEQNPAPGLYLAKVVTQDGTYRLKVLVTSR